MPWYQRQTLSVAPFLLFRIFFTIILSHVHIYKRSHTRPRIIFGILMNLMSKRNWYKTEVYRSREPYTRHTTVSHIRSLRSEWVAQSVQLELPINETQRECNSRIMSDKLSTLLPIVFIIGIRVYIDDLALISPHSMMMIPKTDKFCFLDFWTWFASIQTGVNIMRIIWEWSICSKFHKCCKM